MTPPSLARPAAGGLDLTDARTCSECNRVLEKGQLCAAHESWTTYEHPPAADGDWRLRLERLRRLTHAHAWTKHKYTDWQADGAGEEHPVRVTFHTCPCGARRERGEVDLGA